MTDTQQDWAAQVDRDMRMAHMISRAEHEVRVAEAVAAALREAADACDAVFNNPKPTLWNYGTPPSAIDRAEWRGRKEAAQDLSCEILSLIPDAGAALDRALREAEARGMERTAEKLIAEAEAYGNRGYSFAKVALIAEAKAIRAKAAAIRAQEGE